ncbi:hypothetical protein [Hungatella effluvii]|uniref:hypothetical protein n=1 Tax=Hungatella effluvii TaxID=1096246 RepID=UPI0022E8522E|nr:hypothetical protein [Hungatella effluvii]
MVEKMPGAVKMVEDMGKQLQSISNEIDKLSQKNEIEEERAIKKDVVLFFSFDVVNSTSYKTVNYYGWAQVLNLLFKELREEVCNKIKGSEMWRVLGDEAIFIIKIRDEDELREYINKVFKIMVSTIYKLKKGEFFNSDNNFNLMKLQNILSLKTAAWIAAVNDVGDISNKRILQEDVDNIFERYQSQEGYEIFEFLGNDIDTGFRIATQTQDGRMVLGYDLAYLISQKTESLSYLHIITYKKLKGVWKDKLYPVIWYHDPKAYLEFYKKEIQLQDSFTFDASDESELIKEYYENRDIYKTGKTIHDVRMYTEVYFALNKILQDRGLAEKIDNLQQLIKDAIFDHARYIDPELMQVHCVAVCFKRDEAGIKILVAQRQETRERHRGQWEFGCAKAVIDKSIAQRIKEEYKQDFNIDIEPVIDVNREIQEPIPIALYQIDHTNCMNRTCKKDKGIITLAKIIGDYKLEDFKMTSKHKKVQWVEESDLANIKSIFEKQVPDFEQTLKKSFEVIKSL